MENARKNARRPAVRRGSGNLGVHPLRRAERSDLLSAAQIEELLDQAVRPSVEEIRAFLRANDEAVFNQVRGGGFVLGRHYQLRG